MRRLLDRALCLFTLVGCAGAHSPAPRSEPGPPDAIVVLGHRPPLDEHGVEYETRARVEHGVLLYQRRAAPVLLFSGGPSTKSAVEADVMARYATQLGVPSDAILRERDSLDTIENARLTVALLRRRIGGERRPRVILVTSDYHLARAARLFRCAGALVDPRAVTLALSEAEAQKRRRSERFVRLLYLFFDECRRARSG